MNKKQITRLMLAAVLMLGIQAQAAVIAFDGFDTTADGDSSNGVYKHDIGLGYLPNADPAGGNMVVFDATRAWTAGSSYLRTYNNQLVLLPLSISSRIATRQLTSGTMTGKTEAYGSVDFNINFPADSGTSKIGFTTQTATSSVGATMRVQWDATNLEWDIDMVYNDGSITVGNVVSGISLYTDYNVIWGMDTVNDTLKVWVNATSTSDAPTATFIDYAGTVNNIDDAYIQYSGMDDSASFRDGLTYDNLTLGDTMADVIPEPATLGMVGFATLGLLVCRRLKI